jgi:hypothetical protein
MTKADDVQKLATDWEVARNFTKDMRLSDSQILVLDPENLPQTDLPVGIAKIRLHTVWNEERLKLQEELTASMKVSYLFASQVTAVLILLVVYCLNTVRSGTSAPITKQGRIHKLA